MARPPRPEDLYRLRIPTDPVLAPDGSLIAFTLQTVPPTGDGYRHAIWAVPVPGGPPWRLTRGGEHDRHARFSPDGAWLAFLSDRGRAGEDHGDGADAEADGGDGKAEVAPTHADAPRGSSAGPPDGTTQVHLLSMQGGEARRLTDLPRGVETFAWSPDGRHLACLSAVGPMPPPHAGRGPRPADYRYIDRLGYMLNGQGFRHDRVLQLWLVDVASGTARQLTRGRTDVSDPAWSPDGSRIAFAADRRRVTDLDERADIVVVDVASGLETLITGGRRASFHAPCWLPDGRTVAAMGHRFPAGGGSRADLWLFAADGSDAGPNGGRNLTGRHDLMLGTGLAGDLTPAEAPRLAATADGTRILFGAPFEGAAELWTARVADGAVERLTAGHHHISGFDVASTGAGGLRVALIRSDPTHPSEVAVLDVPPDPGAGGRRGRRPAPRALTAFNRRLLRDVTLVEPSERWTEVDGRRIQGWYLPAQGDGAGAPPPLVTQIHGGPHAYYGWTPFWEFQVLAGAGMAVYASNPRGSEGYGQEFNAANHRDWGHGPMRDVLAGIDALVAEGLADPDRLGLTGGSYGGYLTTWTIAHDHRFRAALTARSVSDVAMLMLTGDISGGEFGRQEFGVAPWDDPDYYREISPLTYAARIRTPLLIQHAENDIRTTVGQAEALFTVLRSLRRPVRFMRVPEENHELTRSGTPFRRVENLVQVRDWFAHFLVARRRGLPPIPRPDGARRSAERA